MDRIVLAGIPPYDGEYEFDASYFTNREYHTIKRIAGVRAGELDEALGAGDLDVIVALAVIALQRNNQPHEEDTIWDAPGGSISFIGSEDVVEDPTVPAEQPQSSSGDGSKESSGHQGNGQSPTGSPNSETPTLGLVSGQAI